MEFPRVGKNLGGFGYGEGLKRLSFKLGWNGGGGSLYTLSGKNTKGPAQKKAEKTRKGDFWKGLKGRRCRGDIHEKKGTPSKGKEKRQGIVLLRGRVKNEFPFKKIM